MATSTTKTVTNSSADVTGLRAEGIEQIKSAITAWVNAIQKADTLSTTKKIATAVKGSGRQAEVKSLCQGITSKVNELTKLLLKYNTDLDNIKTKYKQNDTTASTAITNASKAIKNIKS